MNQKTRNLKVSNLTVGELFNLLIPEIMAECEKKFIGLKTKISIEVDPKKVMEPLLLPKECESILKRLWGNNHTVHTENNVNHPLKTSPAGSTLTKKKSPSKRKAA